MKEIRYSKDARKELLSGVEIIAKAVKTTLGPSGRNVLIRNQYESRPFSTKDGVTVAGQISSEHPIEQIAIESLQDIANITDEGAGDGTTTATVLAEAILKEGMKRIDEYNVIDVKRGLEEASRIIVQLLKDNAIDVSEDMDKLREVAMISSNHDEEIANIVFDAFQVAGKQGIVNIKRSRSFDSYVKSIEGMTLPIGYLSKYYINRPEEVCELEKPWVYITDKKITKISENLDHLLGTAAENDQAVLIMCAGVDPAVSEMFIRNVQAGSINLCVTRNPGFGNEQADLLRDLGTVLGKEPFIENEGLNFDEIDKEDLFSYIPRCKEVTLTDQNTSFKGAYFEEDAEENAAKIERAKEARADNLREQTNNTQTQYEKSVLQTRISRLSDGIAFINIGARSETEFKEKQARVQDALYAIKAAFQEGIIPGGGAALYSISGYLELDSKSANESTLYGAEILKNAIQRPMLQIIENVGDTLTEEDLEQIRENFRTGYNAIERTIEPDMFKANIIDPVKVTRVALESAVSISSMVLTTECAIVDTAVYENNKPQF